MAEEPAPCSSGAVLVDRPALGGRRIGLYRVFKDRQRVSATLFPPQLLCSKHIEASLGLGCQVANFKLGYS